MQKIQDGEEEKGDTDIKEVIIVYQTPWIPNYRKSTGCYYNGNPIYKTMEEIIVLPADEKDYRQYQQ